MAREFLGGADAPTAWQTLAQALLCERNPPRGLDPCGECPCCVQVRAGTHPDLILVARPEEKHELPIQVIRQLTHDIRDASSQLNALIGGIKPPGT